MDKLLFINLQGNRKVSGTLRGFDIFLNLVLDDAREEGSAEKTPCGTVVSSITLCIASYAREGDKTSTISGCCKQVIRGNSVTSIEMTASR
jgi:small nuclear ribonucleoprotein (snRNP)-like protein